MMCRIDVMRDVRPTRGACLWVILVRPARNPRLGIYVVISRAGLHIAPYRIAVPVGLLGCFSRVL
jgi:hypothetical protein